MSKKRPIFEYKGFQGLIDSINNATAPKEVYRRYDPPYPDDSDRPYRSQRHHQRQPSRHRHSRQSHSHRSKSRQQRPIESGQRKYQPPKTVASSKEPNTVGGGNYDPSPEPSPEKRYEHAPVRPPHVAPLPPSMNQSQHYPQPGETASEDHANKEYPQPDSTINDGSQFVNPVSAAAAAAAASAVASAAKLQASVAHSTDSKSIAPAGGTLPPSMAHSKRAYSDVLPPDDVLSQAAPSAASGVTANQGHAQSGRFSQAQPPKSIPARLKEGIIGLLPRRGPIKVVDASAPTSMAVPPLEDDGYIMQGMSDGRSRLTTGTAAQGLGAAGSARPQTAAVSQVTRPMPTEPPKEKEAIEKEKQHRTIWKAVKIAGALGAALLVRNAWKSWNGSKSKKNKRRKGNKKYDSDDESENEEFEDEHGQLQKSSRHRKEHPLNLRLPEEKRFGGFVSVPQSEAYIIERGGTFHRKVSGGSTFLMPFKDKVAFRHSLREIGIYVDPMDQPLECYTRDSVPVQVSTLMFVRIEDPVEASYGVEDLNTSISMVGLACLKREISTVGMKDLFTRRDAISERIASRVNQASRPWGVRCVRFDITDLEMPEDMHETMERETHAERLKHADILQSEGQRQALINKADAEMQAQMRMSQARQMDIVNQAIGEAHAIQERGEAIANAMRDVAQVVNEPGGEQAMRLRLAEQYLQVCSRANNGESHQDPAQVAEAMLNAFGLLNALGDPNANVANPYVAPHQRQGHPGGYEMGMGVGGPPPGVNMPGPPPPPPMPNPLHQQPYMDEDHDDDGLDEEDEMIMSGAESMQNGRTNTGLREGDNTFGQSMDDINEGMRRTDDRGVPNMYGGADMMQGREFGHEQPRRDGQGATFADGSYSSQESSADYEARMQSPGKPRTSNGMAQSFRPAGERRPQRRVTIIDNYN